MQIYSGLKGGEPQALRLPVIMKQVDARIRLFADYKFAMQTGG
jgi:hypothetical protein